MTDPVDHTPDDESLPNPEALDPSASSAEAAPREELDDSEVDDAEAADDSEEVADEEEVDEEVEAEQEIEQPVAVAPPRKHVRGQPISEAEVEEGPVMNWFILKVQSNREDSIADALKRRINIEGLGEFFGDIIVPVELVTEFTKTGKKRTVKRKLYPGYIVVHMIITDETWFLVRETPGIGDFTGAGGKPVPMLPHEVARIVQKAVEPTADAPKFKFNFKPGGRVKIIEGTFENFEGDVDAIDEANGRVTVMINIFGRSTPVELEHWQAEAI